MRIANRGNRKGEHYQSLRRLQSGLARLTPPRSKGGNIRPPRIVVCTMDETSCVDTRPYHTPAP